MQSFNTYHFQTRVHLKVLGINNLAEARKTESVNT